MKKYFLTLLFVSSFLIVVSPVLLFADGDTLSFPDANVILISIDSLRADHLGCYGYGRKTSPHIDSLAEKSILFENAYSQVPLTTPSHMTMLTSLYPSVHGVRQHEVSEEEPMVNALAETVSSLPEILKANGYVTGAFVAGGPMSARFGFDRGFDTYEEMDLLSWVRLSDRYDAEISENNFEYSEMFTWMRENKRKKFFLFFHTFSAHFPYISPHYAKFADAQYQGAIPTTYEALHNRQEHGDYFGLADRSNEKDVQHLVDLYDGCISYTDQNIGALFAFLERQQLMDNTIIIITSDHGEEFCEHYGFGHGDLFREHLEVPYIVKVPSNKHKRISSDVRLLDMVPTLLDLLQISFTPKNYLFQGVSLLPLVKNMPLEIDVFSEELQSGAASIKEKKWDYVEIVVANKLWRENCLFNRADDYYEQTNVRQEFPHIENQLLDTIHTIQAKNNKMHRDINGKSIKTKLDLETIERIKSLGYVQ